MAELIAEALRENGFDVGVENSGLGALSFTKEKHPTTIILDITLLGEMSGWDVLRQLKDNSVTHDIPVIISSCADNRQRGNEMGAADCFIKPFPIEKLISSVGALTGVSTGVLGLPSPGKSSDARENLKEFLAGKGFYVKDIIDQGDLLVVNFERKNLSNRHEVKYGEG